MNVTWKLILPICLVFGSTPLSRPSPLGGRIVGGELAPTDGFPYQVGLSITKNGSEVGSFWCGGALIYPDIVLTAAHCVYGGTIAASLIFGTNDIDNVPSNDTIAIDPSDITINADFDPSMTSNDIAVIRLSRNLTLSAAVQTIQLATSQMNQTYLEGQPVTASGWGSTTTESAGITADLRYVSLTVISLESCAAFFTSDLILPTNICTNGLSLTGPCNGDSGGPLTYQSPDGSLYLVGLTSFGNSAGCQSGDPNAYTRITSYLDWIAENTGYA